MIGETKMEKENEIWVDLKISEKEFDRQCDLFDAVVEKAENYTEILMKLFPNSPEDRVKAWCFATLYEEDCNGNDEDTDDLEE